MSEIQEARNKRQNYKSRLKTFNFLVVLLTFEFLILTLPHSIHAVANPQSYEITVSAAIGEPKLTLFGYSSPNSLVELKGNQVSEQVIANEQGYFFFDRIFLPRPKSIYTSEESLSNTSEVMFGANISDSGQMLSSEVGYPELCLTSIDSQSRISFPICLPQLPVGPYNISVGPVLLPPTISLEKGSFLPKEQIRAEGLTIPNSEVTVFLANDDKASNHSPRRSPFGHLRGGIAFAYSLPKYQIQADKNGKFEFNLPTIKKANWKIFAATNFLGSPSPKSNTLNFKILSWWEWLLSKIVSFLRTVLWILKPFDWLIVILIEITVVLLLIIKRKAQIEKRKIKV